MNLFQLVLKQMRQRALSTWLTLLSVIIGVALAVSILVVLRESDKLMGQSDFGYDIIIGPPKGGGLTLVLNTAYHLEASAGTLPYSLYDDMARKGPPPQGRTDYRFYVKQAIPFMVGDSYNGRRLVGTSPAMFGFDDEGKPLKGYDEKGQLQSGYQDPDLADSEIDKSKPVAASTFHYSREHKYELAEGTCFRAKRFEAVIGSDVAEHEHLKIGSTFRATHGFPGPNEKPDIHKPTWTVVGILKTTHTANDRVLFLPVISLYSIAEHENGILTQALMKAGINPEKIPPDQVDEVLRKLGFDPAKVPASALKTLKMEAKGTKKLDLSASGGELMKDAAPAQPAEEKKDEGPDPDAYHLDGNGDIVTDLPKEEWELSAILVKSRSPIAAEQLMYRFKVIDNEAIAVNPATEMRTFFQTFFKPSSIVLLAVSCLVMIVAAVSILVSIYNAISARMREIAILRALGATRRRVLAIFCTEGMLVGLFGAAAGLVLAHVVAAIGSTYFSRTLGQSIAWYRVSGPELLALVAAVVVAALAGLVPAMKAYKAPVAVNLVS